MNPVIMDMLAKAKEAEIIQQAEKQRLLKSRQTSDGGESMRKLAFTLAVMGAIVLLVVWAFVAV